MKLIRKKAQDHTDQEALRHQVHFRIFGNGYQAYYFEGSHTYALYLNQYSDQEKSEIIQNINSGPKGGFRDESPDKLFPLYFPDKTTRLEVKTARKNYKIFFRDILRPDLILPSPFIRQTENFDRTNGDLLLLEEVSGTFGSCLIQDPEFTGSGIRMHITKLSDSAYVAEIYYKDQLLEFMNKDLVIRSVTLMIHPNEFSSNNL